MRPQMATRRPPRPRAEREPATGLPIVPLELAQRDRVLDLRGWMFIVTFLVGVVAGMIALAVLS